MNNRQFMMTRQIWSLYRHCYVTCFPRRMLNSYHIPAVISSCKYSVLVSKWTPFSGHKYHHVMTLCRQQFHSAIKSQTLSVPFSNKNSSSLQIADKSEGDVEETVKPLTIEGSWTLYKLSRDILEDSSDIPLSAEAWEGLIRQILSENVRLSVCLPGMIMKMISNKEKFLLAESLLKYLRSSGQTVNIVTLATFISICGKVHGKAKQDELYQIYEEVKTMSKLFDSALCRCLIDGVSRTDRWAETLPLLEMIKISTVPSSYHYSPIAAAAFRERDYETGLELLERMGQEQIVPCGAVFSEFISNVPSHVQKSEFTVEVLLRMMRMYGWIPDRNVAEQLAAHFFSRPSESWRYSWTSVSERGVCSSCGQTHPVLELTTKEFSQLQSTFLQKALISDNVYMKSRPEEVNGYLKFIHSCPRFDVIVDGLNMAKLRKAGGSHIDVQIRQLKQIVNHLVRVERLTVLVLGRKHMQRWNIGRLTPCFLLDNSSADDPFLLHATLHSGRRTRFLSNDHMDDHHHLLGTQIGHLFRKWQRSRQLKLHKISPSHLEFKKPQCYDTLIVEDRNGWHIPYIDDVIVTEDESEDVRDDEVKTWLCLRKTS